MNGSQDVRDAYAVSAHAWSAGPDKVFGAMADALVARCPVPLRGAGAVDLGTGSGTVARALLGAGANVVVADDVAAMLATARTRIGGPALLCDVRHLPVRAGAFTLACAGFVLNHLADPAAALIAMRFAVRPGGAVLASTWARGPEHPVKVACEAELVARGWERPSWYARLKDVTTPLTDTDDGLAAAARDAGLVDIDAHVVTVDLSHLTADDMIGWRLGITHSAPFVASLTDSERVQLVDDVKDRLDGVGAPFALQMVVLSSRVAA
jgi:SAM-dependent methyltransferase